MTSSGRPPGALADGSRVLLRAPRPEDRDEVLRLNRASRCLHRGLVSPAIRPEQFATYLWRCGQANRQCFLVCQQRDGAILGGINLSEIVRGGLQSAYLGYFIGAPFAGRGYMTEALRLAVGYAFRRLKLHRLEANIQPGNAASIALVRRAGFTREGFSRRYLKVCGRWRDHERWAMLADDWRAGRLRERPPRR